MIDLINPKEYHNASKQLRAFFEQKGFVEVPTQSRLSILAACEDPSTIGQFSYSGKNWPLPQTGQMWLEIELLKNPEWPGVFCQSTSYRQEANPIPGRHNLIFPMFEFESKGNLDDLVELGTELLEYLGFPLNPHYNNPLHAVTSKYNGATYKETLKYLGLPIDTEIESKDEDRIWTEKKNEVYFLTHFPEYTSPFWNMKRNNDELTANKCDVILYGIETIGSAEREVDPAVMLQRFNSISNGEYANLLYAQFGRGRVMRELGEFLDYDFFPRTGGGIGMTRMIRALKMLNNK